MVDILKEYKNNKCKVCKNINRSCNEDLCCIRVFCNNNNIYCKCTNSTEQNQELKRRVI